MYDKCLHPAKLTLTVVMNMPLKVGVLLLITTVTVNQVRNRVVMTDWFIPFFNATIYLAPSATGAIPLKGNCKLVLVSVE